jgi:hypothetical protein
MINNQYPNEDESTLRDYLLPGAPSNHDVLGKDDHPLVVLKRHLDGGRTLVLRRWQDARSEVFYHVVSELGLPPPERATP